MRFLLTLHKDENQDLFKNHMFKGFNILKMNKTTDIPGDLFPGTKIYKLRYKRMYIRDLDLLMYYRNPSVSAFDNKRNQIE
jgi:hypothetical protein